MTSNETLLSLRLSVDYPGKPEVLKNIALEVRSGEIVGLVGQTGSGKSTLALAVLKLLAFKGGVSSGELYFQGQDLMKASEKEMRKLRGRKIALVLQSPLSALNPALRIETQMVEAWNAHARGFRGNYRSELATVFGSVNLPCEESFLRRYPSQLSVGQAQRVLIAMAILHRPALLIADEPTSALDAITQSEILHLFSELNRRFGMGILYISHDLLSMASLCHRIAILHDSEIVESGETGLVFRHPVHPYTRKLIDALPKSVAVLEEVPPVFAQV